MWKLFYGDWDEILARAPLKRAQGHTEQAQKRLVDRLNAEQFTPQTDYITHPLDHRQQSGAGRKTKWWWVFWDEPVLDTAVYGEYGL